jgi:hypothetical protein
LEPTTNSTPTTLFRLFNLCPVTWQKFIHDLFSQKVKSPAHPGGEVHELIVRDAQYTAAYKTWLSGEDRQEWNDRLRCAFNMHRASVDSQDDCIDFLEFRATSGFVMHLQNEEIPALEASFIMDHLRDLTLKSGYRMSVSDRRTKGSLVIEKHYLKPPIHRGGCQPINQLYGNITIELTIKQGNPCSLKFIATHYQDRSYLPPLDISELLEAIIR